MDPDKQLTDEDLIRLINNGGPDEEFAIRDLYAHYFEPLCKQVVFNGGTNEDGQDVFQDTVVAFIHAVKRGKYRGDASIKTYLYAMNRNIWMNAVRSRDRAMKREKNYESMERKEEAGAAFHLEHRQVSRQLMELMGALGDNCRKILLQFYYEEKPMREIVASLDYENEQVVRNKKSKCLKKLAEMLRERRDLVEQLQNMTHE